MNIIHSDNENDLKNVNKRTRKGALSKDLKKQEDEERGPFIFKGWLLGGQRPVCPEETSTAKSRAIKIFLWLDYSENDQLSGLL